VGGLSKLISFFSGGWVYKLCGVVASIKNETFIYLIHLGSYVTMTQQEQTVTSPMSVVKYCLEKGIISKKELAEYTQFPY